MPGRQVTTERVAELVRELFPMAERHEVGLDDSLFEGGILDSLGVLDLVAALEETFDVVVEDEDLVPENFQTIARIGAFVRSKRQPTA